MSQALCISCSPSPGWEPAALRGLAEALARPLLLARLPSTFSQRLADSTSFVASVALFLLLVKCSASDVEMLAADMESAQRLPVKGPQLSLMT